jgi:hypothetical protein
MRGVHREIHGARLVVSEKRFRPGLAAVGRLENATLGIGPVRISQSGDIDDVWIRRVDPDAGDCQRLLESDVRECLAPSVDL